MTSPLETPDAGLSAMDLLREAVKLGDFRDFPSLVDAVPLRSPDAPEALQWHLGYLLWEGQFARARNLLQERSLLGVPDSLELQVRRWQMERFLLLATGKEPHIIPAWDNAEQLPDWIAWARMVHRHANHSLAGMHDLLDFATRPEFQARLLVDRWVVPIWESVLPLLSLHPSLAGRMNKIAGQLLDFEQPSIFRFSLGNVHDISPRFRLLFSLNLVRDEGVLDPANASRQPDLYGGFLEWFSARAAQTRLVLHQIRERTNALLADSSLETAVAFVQTGCPWLAYKHLLDLAARDREKFHAASTDVRMRNMGNFFLQCQKMEAAHPGVLETLQRLQDLEGERERFLDAINALPGDIRENPLVRYQEARALFFQDEAQVDLEKLQGLEIGLDPEPDLLRALICFHRKQYDDALGELWSAPPNLALHPFYALARLHFDDPEDEPPFPALLAGLKEVPEEKIHPRRGSYAVYLVVHRQREISEVGMLPGRLYLRKCFEDTPGGAIRQARALLREAILAIGDPLRVQEQMLRFWIKTIGLEVLVVPDVRPHFSSSTYLEQVLPDVLRQLENEQEQESIEQN